MPFPGMICFFILETYLGDHHPKKYYHDDSHDDCALIFKVCGPRGSGDCGGWWLGRRDSGAVGWLVHRRPHLSDVGDTAMLML